MKIAYLFPGQGAQYVGMGKSFYDTFTTAREVFQLADELLNVNLSKTIFSGPDDRLGETAVSQPAIFTASYAILATLQKHFSLPDPFCATGLSLGEYTALTASNYISFEKFLPLVRFRGELMHEAATKTKGGMAALIGPSVEEVQRAIFDLSLQHDLFVANINCPGQIVVSGTLKGLQAIESVVPNYTIKRFLPLRVEGAFHSPLMKEAEKGLHEALASLSFAPSSSNIAMNVTGTFLSKPQGIPDLLSRQLTSSVLFMKCATTCADTLPDLFLEMGPGKTLQGMVKRIGIKTAVVSIETIEDIKALEPILSKGI